MKAESPRKVYRLRGWWVGDIHGKEHPSEDVVRAWWALSRSEFPWVVEGRCFRTRAGIITGKD